MLRRLRFQCLFLAATLAAAGPADAQDSLDPAAIGSALAGAIHSLVREPGSELSRDQQSPRSIQQALKTLGFYRGEIDGILGPASAAAIRRYQASRGSPVTGILTREQTAVLMLAVNAQRNPPARLTPVRRVSAIPRVASGTIATAQTTAASYNDAEIYASRLFAGPGEYPPTQFAAYGIVAFKSRASNFDRDRQMMICEAYVNSIRPFQQIGKPVGEQMATVWPVLSRETARLLSNVPEREVCGIAVDQYGSLAADKALREAAAAGGDLDGLGPFLLAWSPPRKKGKPDAIVLVADLSDVENYEGALSVMLSWVEDIERDPQLWTTGWSVEGLRLKAQKWFDRRGSQFLLVFGD